MSSLFLPRSLPSDHVYKAINVLPITTHPMTQFTTGVLALQVSFFIYWEPTFEDSLSLIAQPPVVAAYTYRRIYKNGEIVSADDSLDYGANFAHMLGFDSPAMQELEALCHYPYDYEILIYCSDHEGGNVSAHIGHLMVDRLDEGIISPDLGVLDYEGL
ncbi:hypothetical protein Lser_V15G26208 [Lactuca serriola]